MRHIKKMVLMVAMLSILLLLQTVLFAGCSSSKEDDNEGGGGSSLPYWTLGVGNGNMPSSGTIIAQYTDAPAGFDISKLVDGDPDTKYVTNHDNFNVTWNGNSNVAVLTYTLTSAADAPESDPQSWILEGSADNKQWKTLDEQRDQTFAARKEKKTFDISNGTAYRYYRLSVTGNHGAKSTGIAEWTLSAVTFSGNIDDLMQHASGKTFTSVTPMGTQHLNDRVATDKDLAWLADASQEPDKGGYDWATYPVTTLYPFGEASPADVNQHAVSDCCLCAVEAHLAYLYPKFIKSIIRENNDNTYTVKLYDPLGKQIEVAVSNLFVRGGDQNIGSTSGKNAQVTWATVLEKAVIKWHQVYNGKANIDGIGTEYVSAIFVGNGDSFAFAPGVLSGQEQQRAVLVSLGQRRIVVGGFRDAGTPIDGQYTTVNFHAYNFTPANDSKYLFVMRNPWGVAPLITGGYSDPHQDGLLPIADDNALPPIIDLRICDPGAAKGFAIMGEPEPYRTPAF